jgi:hypothetical protein
MTRPQRRYDDRRPDDSRADANTAMYGRLDRARAGDERNGWGTDEQRGGFGTDERRGGWGGDGRMPDRRSEELRRPPAEPMPDRRSEELRRPVRARVEPDPEPALDPINPYAVVALVAALLGVFPVAIVFGLLAFSHRGGRGLAVSALVLGVLEIVALIGVLVVAHGAP